MGNPQGDDTIVRWLTLADLPGAGAKRLEVPPGHVGLVVESSGRTRLLPPGRHRVVGLWRRLFGRVSDWQFALVPTGPIPLLVPVPRLRAGDGGWADLTCALTVRVADAERFSEKAIRGGESLTLAALAQQLSTGIEGVARQAVAGWAAEDLARGAATERLVPELRRALTHHADALGLEVELVRYISVRPSEEAAEVARKQAELEAALAEVEMGRRMDDLASEAEWREFVQQLQADYAIPRLGDEAMTSAAEGESVPRATRLRAAVRRYAAARDAATSARVERLLGRRETAPPRVITWWEHALPWLKVVSAVLVIGALLFFFLLPETTTLERLGLGVELACALPTAAVLFISALWLERRAMRERSQALGGAWLLRLGRGEREQIDRLVRGQLASALESMADALRDARDRAYREGQRQDALVIKDVEERAVRLEREIAVTAGGTPPYLAAARVSREELHTMLDYDEALVAQAGDLSELVEALRQAVLAGEPVAGPARHIEGALSDLAHRFQARARFIQATTRTPIASGLPSEEV